MAFSACRRRCRRARRAGSAGQAGCRRCAPSACSSSRSCPGGCRNGDPGSRWCCRCGRSGCRSWCSFRARSFDCSQLAGVAVAVTVGIESACLGRYGEGLLQAKFSMSSCSRIHPVRLASMVLVCMVLGGCASASGGEKPSAQVNTLYRQLDQASKGYETALQQSREGHPDASQLTLRQSLDQLKQAAAQCGDTPGCDPQRFFSVFDRLLRLKDGDFDDLPDLSGDVESSQAALATGHAGAASLPQAQRSVTLLHGQKLSQLIAMNGPVKAALEMWLTQRRPQLMDAWVNYQYLRYQMWPQYQKADLPEALLFGIMAKESGGKVHAVSRSGASGPLQFMYATGMRFGLGVDNGFDTRFDPAASARANAEYLNEQLRIFNNNLELVIAAYNGGEGRMRRVALGLPPGDRLLPRVAEERGEGGRLGP